MPRDSVILTLFRGILFAAGLYVGRDSTDMLAGRRRKSAARAVKPADSGYPQGDPTEGMDADPPEKREGIIIS